MIKIIARNIFYIDIELYPTMPYRPGLKMIIGKILQQVNQKQPVLPDGSNRKINLKLGSKINSFFAFVN